MIRRGRGFTLIEVLVTSVIVAILAAIAVPLYSGFLSQQRQSAVKSLAETAAIQANGLDRKGIAFTADELKAKLFLPEPEAYTFSISGNDVTVTDAEHHEATATVCYASCSE